MVVGKSSHLFIFIVPHVTIIAILLESSNNSSKEDSIFQQYSLQRQAIDVECAKKKLENYRNQDYESCQNYDDNDDGDLDENNDDIDDSNNAEGHEDELEKKSMEFTAKVHRNGKRS